MKSAQPLIAVFLGVLGIIMIINFFGNYDISGFVSLFIGIALVLICVGGIVLFFKGRKSKKIES